MKRLAILFAGLLLASCVSSGRDVQPSTNTAMPSPITITATPTLPGVWVQPGVPGGIATRTLETLTRSGFTQVDNPGLASVKLVLNPPADAALTARIVYALAAPFPTIPDGVSWADLQAYWQGQSPTLPGFDTPPQFVVAPEVADMISARLGTAGNPVVVAGYPAQRGGSFVEAVWNSRPAITIVPFDQLEPRWKVINIDGQSPLDKKLDAGAYPLTLTVGVVAADPLRDQVVSLLQPGWESANRDPSKMTVVVMTGTTALTRSTAYMMDLKGVNYPAQNILPFFADKDILHVSNEVSFTPKCPPPDPNGGEKFCSNPKYLGLLTTIGANVVELTGNHNNDYGVNPDNYSLDLYDQADLPYYGGGRNLQAAMTPRVLTAPDGTRLAFVGCNSAGPFKAYATAQTPGAAPCGDWGWIKQTIADLKTNHRADVVIATVQYHESESYTPEAKQVPDFQALADAGADIVSGSQAHVPQGFAITPTSFIHYGLGNLFFDQMDLMENRQMFADKYILYQGRPISVVLFTGIMEDYSQPRPMTPQERADFLKLVFSKSGW